MPQRTLRIARGEAPPSPPQALRARRPDAPCPCVVDEVLTVEQACRAELSELGRRFGNAVLFCDPDFKAGAPALGAALATDRWRRLAASESRAAGPRLRSRADGRDAAFL